MTKKLIFPFLAALSVLVLIGSGAVQAISPAPKSVKTLQERSVGAANAPVTMIEYASLTCSHCADFYTKVLPELEKTYIATGKLRVIYRDYPLEGVSLRAAALGQCLPETQFFPYIKTVYANMMTWIRTPKPEETLLQYAQMAGLDAEKARACLGDVSMMDAIVAQRAEADQKYNINSTPTFIFNDGAEKLIGARPVQDFTAVIDRLLSAKK